MWVNLETSWGWCVPVTRFSLSLERKFVFQEWKFGCWVDQGYRPRPPLEGVVDLAWTREKFFAQYHHGRVHLEIEGECHWALCHSVIITWLLWRCWCTAEYCCNASSPSGLNKRCNLHYFTRGDCFNENEGLRQYVSGGCGEFGDGVINMIFQWKNFIETKRWFWEWWWHLNLNNLKR